MVMLVLIVARTVTVIVIVFVSTVIIEMTIRMLNTDTRHAKSGPMGGMFRIYCNKQPETVLWVVKLCKNVGLGRGGGSSYTFIYIYICSPPVIYHFRTLKPNLTVAAVQS